jgi:hypothetical protein
LSGKSSKTSINFKRVPTPLLPHRRLLCLGSRRCCCRPGIIAYSIVGLPPAFAAVRQQLVSIWQGILPWIDASGTAFCRELGQGSQGGFE